ncbi:PfkB family carbohydrate kinase, partial [Chloroflexota bacterium]
DSQEDFLRQAVGDNIDKMFLYKANSPTIVKRRFIENYLLQKLFEVYEINDEELNEEQDTALYRILQEILPRYDVVVVVDYGHGMLSRNVIELLCSQSRFLAVNTQANAGNRGFNTISKYPRADYVCIAQNEIALEERNQGSNVKEMILSMLQKVACGQIVVTRGRAGSTCYSDREGFTEVPAFVEQVVDRMGAGDAVISITAQCVAQQAPMEVVGLIGNAVGAQAVTTLGHRTSIERAPLFKFIDSLLK